MRVFSVVAAVALLAGTLTAQSASGLSHLDASLIQRWKQLNIDCRGSPKGLDHTPACAKREAIGERLEERGFCYANLHNKTGGNEPTWRICWPPIYPE